ncbi:uncharacterized protein TRAVEDRAFT_66816 [Trametes versicolor FP-101664 SS1]|uniref:uncharacterized protein n=1 Tax=Trametes versicolor (strain FP-101664) TaxID=717944 RepID=UPI000462293C|nr:uncharacterized protein TRAVEDRAFT_66816 [Trametes versicolor FP-101664 SS1]EIW54461.1 hypothetical protein TRAVEDRAFT_66816 [Trametes versicolor FP-101664 SS1]
MLRLLASSSRTSARSTVTSSKTGARPSASSSNFTAGGSRSRSTYTRRVLRRPDELTRAKIQVEAVSGELPSTPSGSPTGFGGSGGGAANGARDAVLTTIFGVIVLFTGGVVYMSWYKENVLWKIEKAFAAGYDPALELAKNAIKRPNEAVAVVAGEELEWDLEGPWTQHLRRSEQDLIDRIIKGQEVGHYFILLGPKGTGKTTMILDAMQAVQAEGVAMCDAHPDLEVFRLRLGKALNYEYNEDTQTGLFQRRDPREGGPALDIERALNKLEKVALRHAKTAGKPLILILNNVHYFNHDDDGRNMLLQFQQRAEGWAASGILTMVFSSDDSWPFFVMRKNASRMHVVSVYDLSAQDAQTAARRMRMNARQQKESPEVLTEMVKIVGGRLTYLGKATKAPNMVEYAKHMLAVEKAWLLSQIGLIPDCDDDVMDEQKWSSCSWLLLREFVHRHEKEVERIREAVERGEAKAEELEGIPLPRIPYYECRQIMTRPDFMDDLDRKNIIAIDINHDVTPDSWLILHAAEEVVGEEGFDDLLDSVRGRVDEIESLHRTRELTFKDVDAGDRIRLTVDKGGARVV